MSLLGPWCPELPPTPLAGVQTWRKAVKAGQCPLGRSYGTLCLLSGQLVWDFMLPPVRSGKYSFESSAALWEWARLLEWAWLALARRWGAGGRENQSTYEL